MSGNSASGRTSGREQRVTFRATGPEISLWQDLADEDGKSLSDWIRTRLNRRDGLSIEAEILTKQLGELQKLTDLLSRWLAEAP